MRSIRVVLALACLAGAMVVGQAAPALATACDTSQSNFFEGFKRTGPGVDSTWGGISADIKLAGLRAAECTTPGNNSTAWVMLADDGGGGHAQIGQEWDPVVQGWKFFWEWQLQNGAATHGGSGLTPGTSGFKVKYFDGSNADHHIHMLIDVNNTGDWVDKGETDFDPAFWWNNYTPEVSGEFIWETGYFMGTSSNKAAFTNGQMIDTPGGSWQSTDWDTSHWVTVSTTCHGNHGRPSGTTLYIWDAAC